MVRGEIEIIFQPHGRRAVFQRGITILEAARRSGVDISSLCGGKGTCGKCKVKVEKGKKGTNPLTEKEMKHLSRDEKKAGFRLSCQARLSIPSTIYIPERSRVGKQRLQTEGLDVPVALNPLVKKIHLKLSRPDLRDARSDEDRLLDALREENDLTDLEIDYDMAKTLPIELRKKDWDVTAVLWKNKVMAVESGDTSSRCFGFAADIGSTKLAGFLLNLTSGTVVSTAARMNPQIPFGEDILSRITFIVENGQKAPDELQKAVVSGINEMIDECCEKARIKPREIYELNFVGNTAMQMLFLKLWPQYTALAPYPPVIRRGADVESAKIGIRAHPNANAHFLPIIGGFVGADSVADIMAVGMLESEKIVMDIDVGTNTEIAVGNRDLVMAVSCASGPAFEGMEIKHGMRAATGAIEEISIDPESFDVNYRTIDDAAPLGICGSGIIDSLGEMLEAGIIDMSGKIIKELAGKTDRLRKTSEGFYEFILVNKNEAAAKTDITITQADIRELQKAKAAMRAGSEILLKKMNLTKDDIATLYVAGAFGNYIDPESARTIGIYPEVPIERIKFVGNTAGTGSRMCLVSKNMRQYAEEIATKVHYYELASDSDFSKEFVKATFIPHQDLSRQPIIAEMLRKLGRINSK